MRVDLEHYPPTISSPKRAAFSGSVSDLAESFLADRVKAIRRNSTADHYYDVRQRLVLPKLGGLETEAWVIRLTGGPSLGFY